MLKSYLNQNLIRIAFGVFLLVAPDAAKAQVEQGARPVGPVAPSEQDCAQQSTRTRPDGAPVAQAVEPTPPRPATPASAGSAGTDSPSATPRRTQPARPRNSR